MFPPFSPARTYRSWRRARAGRLDFPRPRGLRTPYPKPHRRRAVAVGAGCALVLVALASAGGADGTGRARGEADGPRATLLRTLERERLPGEHVLRSGVARAGTRTRIALDGARAGGEELVLLCRGAGALGIGTEPARALGAPVRRCEGALARLRETGATTVEVHAGTATGDVAWAVAAYRARKCPCHTCSSCKG
ncbi:hypothetical protein ACQYWQ_14605 [Streptomyces sp. P6-2-1]|uniref:hypothetical protein n=1 Tax=unclassified Streptomyces TaxID=2593676 RepID=UPI003D367769